MSIKKRSIVVHGAILMSLLAVTVARPAAADYLYGLDAWEDRVLWIIDPADGSTIGAHEVNVDSGFVSTQNGMAVDPTTGTMYVVLAIDSSSNRRLFTLDPETGDTTLIGSLGYQFSGIVFDDSGTLYGVTGRSGSSPDTLFTIDTSDASVTQVCRFAAGNQGHALSFGDGLLYHAQQVGLDWTGDTMLESVDPANFPVDPADPCPTTSIPLTYDSGGLPIHPMSILVTDTGSPTATLLLSGWHAHFCCTPELYSVTVDGGSATADLIGYPDSYFKGLAFHSFEPTSFAGLGDIEISKVSSKLKEGKSRRVIFTVEVTNLGSNPVSDLVLLDNLDTSKLSYVSDDGGCDFLFGYQVSCDLGTIAAGSTQTVTIDTMVNCKGKNCSSVFNTAHINLPTNQWVSDPWTVQKSSSVETSLKGKY